MSGVSFLLKWSLRAIFERDSLGDERTSSFQTVFLRVPGLRLAGTVGRGLRVEGTGSGTERARPSGEPRWASVPSEHPSLMQSPIKQSF